MNIWIPCLDLQILLGRYKEYAHAHMREDGMHRWKVYTSVMYVFACEGKLPDSLFGTSACWLSNSFTHEHSLTNYMFTEVPMPGLTRKRMYTSSNAWRNV